MPSAPAAIAAFTALICALGCSSPDRNPLLGGGGNGTGGSAGGPDGGGDGDGDFETLTGSICEITDLRRPTSCVSNPSLFIDAGFQETAATADGEFSLRLLRRDVPITFEVTDSDGIYRTTVMRVELPLEGDLDEIIIPVVDSDVMLQVEAGLGVGPSDNVGTVIGYMSRDGAALSGAQVVDVPVGSVVGVPYYDIDALPYLGIAGSTGPYGVIALFGAPADQTVGFELKGAVAEDPVAVTAPTRSGAITFMRYELPAAQ